MAGRRRARRFLVGGLAVAIVVAGAMFILRERGRSHARRALVADTHRLGELTRTLLSLDWLPPDAEGRIDVFRMARRLPDFPDSFSSERSGRGPTRAEIEAGDYSNFPGARGRAKDGDGPLLWERRPDERGRRLVAFRTGAVRLIDAEEFAALAAEE